METLAMLVGMFAGTVSPQAAEAYFTASDVRVAYVAEAVQPREMSDTQLLRKYPAPEGWDEYSWAQAVRSIDLSKAPGRR